MQDTNFTCRNRLIFLVLEISTISEPTVSYYVTTLYWVTSCISIGLFVLSGSMFRGHQPWKLCSRVHREDVWPDVHPEGPGACEWSPWLVPKTCKWKLDLLLFVRLTLMPPFWLREIQRGQTWRSVTRWEGSPITSTSSTTWWELHCNRDEGTVRLIAFYLVFFAEWLCKENWCESTSAMWQSRLWLKGRFKTVIVARLLMSKVILQSATFVLIIPVNILTFHFKFIERSCKGLARIFLP